MTVRPPPFPTIGPFFWAWRLSAPSGPLSDVRFEPDLAFQFSSCGDDVICSGHFVVMGPAVAGMTHPSDADHCLFGTLVVCGEWIRMKWECRPDRVGSHVAILDPVEKSFTIAAASPQEKNIKAMQMPPRKEFAGACGTDLWIESVRKNWQIRSRMHFKFVCKNIYIGSRNRENGRCLGFVDDSQGRSET